MKVEKEEIVIQARRYLDTPFLHLGRTEEGLDCVGLIVKVSQDLGLSNYDIKNYTPESNKDIFFNAFRKCPDLQRVVPINNYQIGDVLIFSLPFNPCHAGILSFDNRIIHALQSSKKVVEHRITKFWSSKIRESYRFKEVL